jgi:hypothetical protein
LDEPVALVGLIAAEILVALQEVFVVLLLLVAVQLDL